MKKIFKNLLFASALTFALASCEQEPQISKITFTDLATSTATEGEYTLFTADLSSATDKATVVFAGKGEYLAAGTYTQSEVASDKGRYYLLGKTTVNGVAVEFGNVHINDEGIQGYVSCGGETVHFTWAGEQPWKEPADAPGEGGEGGEGSASGYTATETVAPTVLSGSDGSTTPVEGVETHTITISDAEGNVVATFEALTEEGAASIEGEYTVQGYPDAPGLMGNGWDFMGFMGGGTTFTVDGVKYLVAEGSTITITKQANGKYTFSGTITSTTTDGATAGPTTLLFEDVAFGDAGEGGEGGEGNVPAEPSYTATETVAPTVLSGNDGSTTPVEGVETHTITISDAEGNVVATFETLTAEGATTVEGTYTVQGYPDAPGLMGNGWDIMGYFGGGTTFTVDGVKYLVAEGSTITITKQTNGKFTFSGTITSTTTDYTTAGPTTLLFEDVVFEAYADAEGGEDEFDGVEYTNFLGKVDYSQMQAGPMYGLVFATEGVEGSYAWWQLNATGSGSMMILEIYADGGVAEGTYEVKALDGLPAEGEAKAGSAAGGSAWYTVTDGVQGTAADGFIADGTITVAVDGDTYTITVESSSYKARYVGPLQ